MTMYPAPEPYRTSDALRVIGWIMALCTAFYLLPTAVAIQRSKRNLGGVAVVNILTGWTFLGWVIALVMACTSDPRPQVVYVPMPQVVYAPMPQVVYAPMPQVAPLTRQAPMMGYPEPSGPAAFIETRSPFEPYPRPAQEPVPPGPYV